MSAPLPAPYPVPAPIAAPPPAPTAAPVSVPQAVAVTRSWNCVRLDLLASQLHLEVGEGGCPDDRVELAAVVRDQAHAVQHYVVDGPPPTALEQPVLDRNLYPPVGDDPGSYLRVR